MAGCPGPALIEIPPSVLEAMRCHVADEIPLEACGLLAGRKNRVESLYRIRNALQSQVRFRMDAQEQLVAFETVEAKGQEILAIYHSHPHGPPHPSPTDLVEAAYDVVYIIWSVVDERWQADAFRLDNMTNFTQIKIVKG